MPRKNVPEPALLCDVRFAVALLTMLRRLARSDGGAMSDLLRAAAYLYFDLHAALLRRAAVALPPTEACAQRRAP